MTDLFDAPASATGIDLKKLHGQLLLIKPLRIETNINTTLGPKDATVADVHTLDGDQAGHMDPAVFLWPKVLQSQIAANVGTGRYNLGRLTQGTAKPGQNAPWKLDDPTEADKERARKYLNSEKFKTNTAEAKTTPANDPWSANNDDEPPF
ncbi:MAG: hypothetical protein K2Q25_02320 [Mycobacteriaceae bacterium]|nr:hypothetical protein [Mycobacteriaceae bacterium]